MKRNRPQFTEPFFEMVVSTTGATEAQSRPAAPEKYHELEWHTEHREGQLAVDVLDMGHELMILSTMAGATTEAIEVYIHNDLLTIRGNRPFPVHSGIHEYVYQECFWGPFSRTIVLPIDVRGEFAKAEYKNGILTITVPKQQPRKAIPVVVVDE